MNVLVIGASRGIGSSLAQLFKQSGHEVFAMARSPINDWDFSDFVASIEVDVLDENQLKSAVKTITTTHGSIDIVINCVGIFSASLLMTATSGATRSVIENNLVSADNIMRVCAKSMMRSRRGVVVNLGSLASKIPLPGNGIYGATKNAVERLTYSYALEFKQYEIKFLTIGIPFFAEESMSTQISGSIREVYESHLMNSRPVKAVDILNLINFMNSPSGDLISGQSIYLGNPF